MPVCTVSPQILIAGLSGTCENYEQALTGCGFKVCYPPCPSSGAPFTPAELTTTEFDLLLLPGGGDISPLLYAPKASNDPSSHADPFAGCNPPDYVTDLLQFQLLQLALLRRKPVLGICKGMQLLNVYFGGDLYPHLPTADDHCYKEGDQMHTLSFAPYFPEHYAIWGSDRRTCEALCALLKDFPLVNSAHHQGVHRLGKHMVTIQYTQDFLPETIAHSHLPILGLQWHPERLLGFRENSFGKLAYLLLQSAQL